MSKEKSFVACVRLHGSEGLRTNETQIMAGEPILRRLNRIEHVMVTLGGKIVRRASARLFIAFDSINEAIVSACEAQRHCMALPQIASIPLTLAIGIHKASPEQTPVLKNKPISDRRNPNRRLGFDTAWLLASSIQKDAVVISSLIYGLLDSSTQEICELLPKNPTGIRAYTLDWKNVSSRIINKQHEWNLTYTSSLKLKRATQELGIDWQESPVVTFGRDPGCDILVTSSYASRTHAWIEMTNEGFMLTDHSANGTSISFKNLPPLVLNNEKILLSGHGTLSFGEAPVAGGRNTFEFEVISSSPPDLQLPEL